MRLLLDHCVDVRFAKLLTGHDVQHAKAMGWAGLSNGELLARATEAGFEAMVTVDKNVRFQQNMANKAISLITLNPRLVDYDYIAPLAEKLLANLSSGLPPGSEIVIEP
ncbi:MAG TPA: DUF5615 family PIN-like protein [Fimbriimonadaceae bacterium]|nr:DUF5615 family PIN-like protein [Fimbriimonadaceae bacterium]